MKVEIWSDVMCPFCYIGKRKFEKALEEFPAKDNIEIIWRSFQLDPTITPQPGKDVYSYLAERKGQSLDWSKQMHQHVTNVAKEVGLTYNFDKAVIANSFDAHRFAHLAKKYNLGDAAEEALFKAYFTDGKDTSDHNVLAELGEQIGMNKEEILQVLATDAYAADVHREENEAQQLGARGVPFFVMDRKYGVSGAQDPQIFLQTLQESYAEWQKEHPAIQFNNNADGAVCEPGGECN